MSVNRVVVGLAVLALVSIIVITSAPTYRAASPQSDNSSYTELAASAVADLPILQPPQWSASGLSFQPPDTVILSGQIRGPWLVPMQGVAVVLSVNFTPQQSTTTGADGRYSFTAQAGFFDYTILPFLTGYVGTGSGTSGGVFSDHLDLDGSLSQGNDARDKAGRNPACQTVGEPVDVTTGNMYLEQNDYREPGAWPSLRLVRSYNSFSAVLGVPGLFGVGWSSDYDQFLAIISNDEVRLFEADGLASYFTRTGGAGPFLPVTGDLHAQITRNIDNTFSLTYKEGE